MSDFVDIELSKPIAIAGADVSVLRMREPTVADQLIGDSAKGSDAEKEVLLIANLCDVAPADIKAVRMKDYRKLQKAYLDFLA